MKTIITLLSVFLFLLPSTQAQVYVPSSAKSFGKSKANEEAEKGAQKGYEALLKSMSGSSSDAKIADVYSFKTSVDIRVTSFDKKQKSSEMNMRMLFPPEESGDPYYAVELLDMQEDDTDIPSNLVIFDYLNFKMISLINSSGEKMGFTMELSQDQIDEWTEAEGEENDEKVEFKKTGKTKDILGYSCEQYVFESSDSEGEFWVSNDKDLKIGMALNAMSQNDKKKSYDMPDEYPEGAILEMNYTDSDGSGMKWLAIAIDKSLNKTIRTEGYSFMNLGKM